jgi:hypothetical protein
MGVSGNDMNPLLRDPRPRNQPDRPCCRNAHGTAARAQIEKLLGIRIYLDLRGKVPKNWQRDPKQLGRAWV